MWEPIQYTQLVHERPLNEDAHKHIWRSILRNLQNGINLIRPACCTGSKTVFTEPTRLAGKQWSNNVGWSHREHRFKGDFVQVVAAFLEGHTQQSEHIAISWNFGHWHIWVKKYFDSFIGYKHIFYNYNDGSQKNWPKFLNQVSIIQKHWNVNTIKFSHHIKYSFMDRIKIRSNTHKCGIILLLVAFIQHRTFSLACSLPAMYLG